MIGVKRYRELTWGDVLSGLGLKCDRFWACCLDLISRLGFEGLRWFGLGSSRLFELGLSV